MFTYSILFYSSKSWTHLSIDLLSKDQPKCHNSHSWMQMKLSDSKCLPSHQDDVKSTNNRHNTHQLAKSIHPSPRYIHCLPRRQLCSQFGYLSTLNLKRPRYEWRVVKYVASLRHFSTKCPPFPHNFTYTLFTGWPQICRWENIYLHHPNRTCIAVWLPTCCTPTDWSPRDLELFPENEFVRVFVDAFARQTDHQRASRSKNLTDLLLSQTYFCIQLTVHTGEWS